MSETQTTDDTDVTKLLKEASDDQPIKDIDEVLAQHTTQQVFPPPREGAHVMIDLETWGNGPAAVIVALGAVKFYPDDPDNLIGEKFYAAVDPASCVRLGLQMDVGTILWWMDPKQRKALDAWLSTSNSDLLNVLEGFAMWYGPKSLPTWGNGAGFDNVIVSTAYKVLGAERPWNFRDDRDYRSIKALAPKGWKADVPDGLHHDALSDALWQMQVLIAVARLTGIKLA